MQMSKRSARCTN